MAAECTEVLGKEWADVPDGGEGIVLQKGGDNGRCGGSGEMVAV